MAQKKQIKIASTIEERRESEEQTWYARKERERELVQSRELADGHHIHPRGHLHVAICYAWTQWRHVQTYLARQGFVDVSTTTAKEMDESLLSFLDPVLHVMVPKFPIATNTRLLTSTKNQDCARNHLPLVIFWVNISSGQLLRSLPRFLFALEKFVVLKMFLKWPPFGPSFIPQPFFQSLNNGICKVMKFY